MRCATAKRWPTRSAGSVDPVVDLVDRHDQGVADGERIDRHERHAAIVAVHEGARDLAVDDAGEDGRHQEGTYLYARTAMDGTEQLSSHNTSRRPTCSRCCGCAASRSSSGCCLAATTVPERRCCWAASAPPTGWMDGWRAGSTRRASSARCSIRPPTVCCSSSAIGGIIIEGVAPLWFFWLVVDPRGRSSAARSRWRRLRSDEAIRRHVVGKDRDVSADVRIPGFMLGPSDFAGHRAFLVAVVDHRDSRAGAQLLHGDRVRPDLAPGMAVRGGCKRLAANLSGHAGTCATPLHQRSRVGGNHRQHGARRNHRLRARRARRHRVRAGARPSAARFRPATAFGEVESTKSVSDIYAPVSGRWSPSTRHSPTAPESVNSDPYGDGWLCEIEMQRSEPDSTRLLDASAYQSLIAG